MGSRPIFSRLGTASAIASSSSAGTRHSSSGPGSPGWTCRRTCKRRAPRRAALGVFAQSGAGDAWTLPALPETLTPKEQTEIVEGCYELLLVLAEAVAEPLPGEDAVRQAGLGLDILDRAAGVRSEPTRAYHLRRAACLARKGDAAGEARARAEAERLEPSTVFDHFLAGQERYQREAWSSAIEHFDAVLQRQPDHFWAQCLWAISSLQIDAPAQAKVGLNHCLQREPGFVWLYLLRAYASGQIAEQALKGTKISPRQAAELKAGAEHQFAAAEADYRTAGTMLDQKPNDDLRYILLANRGVMLYQANRLDDAVQDLTEAIGRNDRHHHAIATLANVYQQQKKWDLALEQFGRAIELKPDLPDLYRGRAHVLQARDDPTPERRAAELRDLDEAIRHERPGRSILATDQTRRAELLWRMGRDPEALAACSAAVAVRPGHTEAHRIQAWVLLDMKRYSEVIHSCDGALADGKPWADLHEIRGLARAARKDFIAAIADYTMALEEHPGQTRVLISRGKTYLVKDSPKLALNDFEEALRLDPSSARAHSGRGSALVRLGKHREAVDEAQNALRLGDNDINILYDVLRIYAQAVPAAAADNRLNGRDAKFVVKNYQDRAVGLARGILQRLSPGDGAEFLHSQIQADPALRALAPRVKFPATAVSKTKE